MEIFEQLSQIDGDKVAETIERLARAGFFRREFTREAESRVIDDIFEDFPGLYSAPSILRQAFREDPSQGWDERDAQILCTGVDVALIILHELADRKSVV